MAKVTLKNSLGEDCEVEEDMIAVFMEAVENAKSQKERKDAKKAKAKDHQTNRRQPVHKPTADYKADTIGAVAQAQAPVLVTPAPRPRNAYEDKEAAKEAKRAADRARANEIAEKALEVVDTSDLTAQIAGLMDETENEYKILMAAYKTRDEWNLRKLALDSGYRQFEKNFAHEYAWLRSMADNFARNGVVSNSPLALKVQAIAAKLEDLKAQAVEPLRKALDDMRPQYEEALKVIQDKNESWWQIKKQGGAH